MYDSFFKAEIPMTASKADIANYIVDMLQFPKDGYRQKGKHHTVSSHQFHSWLQMNGCKI